MLDRVRARVLVRVRIHARVLACVPIRVNFLTIGRDNDSANVLVYLCP